MYNCIVECWALLSYSCYASFSSLLRLIFSKQYDLSKQWLYAQDNSILVKT